MIAYNYKGSAFQQIGEYARSIECYDLLIENNPKNFVTYIEKGDVL